MNPLSAKGLSRLKAISKKRLTLGSLCKLKEKLLLLTLKMSTLNNFTTVLKYFTENCLILLKKYNNPLLLFFFWNWMSITCRQRFLSISKWWSRKHTKIYVVVAWGNSLILMQQQCSWRELQEKIPSKLKALVIFIPGIWVRTHYAFVLKLFSLLTKARNHFGTLNGGVSSPGHVAVTGNMQCWEQNVGQLWQNCDLSLVFLALAASEQPQGRMWFSS